jgi:fatty acid desaturase
MPDASTTRSRSGSATPLQDDWSGQFQGLRAQLMRETGGAYLRFVNGLAPRLGLAWRDIGLGYLFLFLVLYGAGLPASLPGQLAAVLLGAVGVGYGVAYLQLFLHEAAHQNLATARARNDWLCDALISWQVGTTVARYRPIHFAHHRHLGTVADTENSYFRPVDARLVLETLTGVHALRVLRNRQRRLTALAPDTGHGTASSAAPWLRAMLLHGLVCAGAYALSGWPGLGAWLLGVGACYPVFATLRQQLEHRSPDADPAADYSRRDHGALTRLFGDGPLASTFGGAGFNRHLLHHWEPQVPYTRLRDLERYLAGTSAAPILDARRSSYLRTLAELWNRSPVPA